MGTVLLELGQYAHARARLQQALGLWERHKGPEHPDAADSLAALGRTLVRLRQPQPARRHLERALVLSVSRSSIPALLAGSERTVCTRRRALAWGPLAAWLLRH
ncbi:MAG TPA: tetratricopeptide repeat protein [Archangium sp.]|nr:tetratricopeptide repeat protein [Archangium sp.]